MLSFTDIADKAGKYMVLVHGHFSERDFHRELLSIFAEAGKLGTLPVDMSLTGSQVASEPILVALPHEFRHEYGQGFPNQLRRVVTKDFHSGGIGKPNCTALVRGDHGIIGRFNNDAMPLFTVATRGFLFFTFSNIRRNTGNSVDLALCIEQGELLDDVRVQPVFLESDLLKFHRNARVEHLSIVGLKGSSLFR